MKRTKSKRVTAVKAPIKISISEVDPSPASLTERIQLKMIFNLTTVNNFAKRSLLFSSNEHFAFRQPLRT